jgi:membrane-associated protein
MEFLGNFIDIFLNLDKYLFSLVNDYRNWTYLILFIVIFCETGLVITPFLPGDSLLFTAGAIAALGVLNIWLLVLILIIAAFMGDTANYSIGKLLGEKVYSKNYKLIKKEHLIKTHIFYEKYGGKTIIIARFIPIIRTFAPFIAGVGKMTYSKFMLYNIIGGILWVIICSFSGYFFGNMSIVKNNFSIVVLAIILISLMPMVVEYLKFKFKHKN